MQGSWEGWPQLYAALQFLMISRSGQSVPHIPRASLNGSVSIWNVAPLKFTGPLDHAQNTISSFYSVKMYSGENIPRVLGDPHESPVLYVPGPASLACLVVGSWI